MCNLRWEGSTKFKELRPCSPGSNWRKDMWQTVCDLALFLLCAKSLHKQANMSYPCGGQV